MRKVLEAASLKKDGTVWTTDKDGIIMALLAMEILAVTGELPTAYYDAITDVYGKPVFGRYEASCTMDEKAALKKMSPAQVKQTELNGETITDVRTTSLYGGDEIEGLRVTTAQGWVVARPSGTEPLYKIYGESFKGEADLESLLKEGQELVSAALK